MKFGVREICDVVLKAKGTMTVGNKIFYKGEPVCYFDTLKTSSLEGSSSTTYATGGRGNARLMSWDGEKAVTFNMEDALISPEGFMILAGAGLVEASATNKIYQHVTETVDKKNIVWTGDSQITITLSKKPHFDTANADNDIYVLFKKDDEIVTEPFIVKSVDDKDIVIDFSEAYENYQNPEVGDYKALVQAFGAGSVNDVEKIKATYDSAIVDYYVEHDSGVKQIEITADSFGGSFYLEASTLFRGQDGMDYPAEFIIPNCRVQSNFNFNMSSTGDPSTFAFAMDAFPDYTKFDKAKKVIAAIQIYDTAVSLETTEYREETPHKVKIQ